MASTKEGPFNEWPFYVGSLFWFFFPIDLWYYQNQWKSHHALMLYQITKSETNWFQGSTCSYQQKILWASALSLSPAESPQAERLKSCTPAFQGNSTSSVNSWLQLRGEFWHGEILQSNCIAPCIKPNSSCFQDKKKASHQFCYHIVIKHFFCILCRVLAGLWEYKYDSYKQESPLSHVCLSHKLRHSEDNCPGRDIMCS